MASAESFLRFDNVHDARERMPRYEAPKPFVYQEYPKWVTPPGGEPMIVQNAEEEARIMGRPAASTMPEPTARPSGAAAPLVAIVAPSPSSQAAAASDAIPGRLVRAARGLLGWSQADLAQRAGLSIPTVQKVENAADGEQRGSADSVAAIEQALSDAGVSWRDDADQCGVSMRKGESVQK